MKKKAWFCTGFLAAVVLSIIACGGSILYTDRDPNMKGFHPRTIGLLSVDVGTYGDARGVIDGIIIASLNDRRWFATVLPTVAMNNQLQNDGELKKTVDDYLLKLRTVNYSDPALSRQIGDSLKIEAFLVATVDSWNYATERDEKVAKAGLSMKLIETATGRIAWKAGHSITKEYTFLRPELKDVGKSVVTDMVGAMPH